MKKKLWTVLQALLVCVSMLTGCMKTNDIISSAEELNKSGMKVGTVQGPAPMYITEEKFPDAEIEYYSSVADGCAAMSAGQLDGFVFTEHVLEPYARASDNITILDGAVGTSYISAAMKKGNTELKAKTDAFIESIKADGTLDDMKNRWTDTADPVMPEIEKPENTEGILRIATEGLSFPFTYFGDNGELTGFDIEFGTRLAYYLNMDVSFISMSFDGLFPALEADTADIILNELNETPERREAVLFSEPYFVADVVVAVRNDNKGNAAVTEKSAADPETARYGILLGSTAIGYVEEKYPNAQIMEFDTESDAVEALKANKIDYVMTTYSTAKNFARYNKELCVSDGLKFDVKISMAVRKGNTELKDKINDILDGYKKDGTLDGIIANWLSDDAPYDISVFPSNTEGEVLNVGICTGDEPMCFVMDGKYCGVDCELIERIANDMGMRVEFQDMKFAALIPALDSGKVDVIIGDIAQTEERAQTVDFTESYYDNPCVLLMRKTGSTVEAATENSAADPETARYGILMGSTAIGYVEKQYPNAQIMEFDTESDAVEALKANKIDYVMSMYSAARNYERNNKELCIYDGLKFDEKISMAVRKGNTELKDKINDILDGYKKDGTLDGIIANWLSDDAPYDISVFPSNTEGEVLNVGICTGDEPMCFVMDGKYCGVDCELIERIANDMGMRVEYQDMKFAALIPALDSGKVDVIISNITQTEERAQTVDFTESYYDNPCVILMKKTDNTAADGAGSEGFLDKMKDSFTRTFITESRWKLVLSGLGVTILISLCSFIIGSLLGCVICAGLRSSKKMASVPARIYVRLLQGTPIVVLLMILYYVVFKSFDISAVIVAIIGFSLNLAAYTSEIFRTAIDSVDKGQTEAAYAIGFNKFKVFTKIIFPQAARNALPVYKGEFISLVKSTSVVGYIAIQDLTKASDIIRSRTYEAFFPLIATAVIYFAVTYIFIVLLNMLQKKIDPKSRRKRRISYLQRSISPKN